MNQNGHGNSLLFEITIVLFFFALSATVMLGMFLKAHDLSNAGRAMNHALFAAQDYAEGLSASVDPDAYLKSIGFKEADQGYHAKDRGFDSTVQLSPSDTDAGRLWNATISVHDGEKTIVELPAAWYIPDASKGAA